MIKVWFSAELVGVGLSRVGGPVAAVMELD